MVMPSTLNQHVVNVLKNIYDSYYDAQSTPFFAQSGVNTLFLINFLDKICFFTCKRTPYNDMSGRPIAALQGILIESTHLHSPGVSMAKMFVNNAEILDVWRKFDFTTDADKLEKQSISTQLDFESFSLTTSNVTLVSEKTSDDKYLKVVSYNKIGFDEMIVYLASSKKLFDIAFGATAKMLVHFDQLQVVASNDPAAASQYVKNQATNSNFPVDEQGSLNKISIKQSDLTLIDPKTQFQADQVVGLENKEDVSNSAKHSGFLSIFNRESKIKPHYNENKISFDFCEIVVRPVKKTPLGVFQTDKYVFTVEHLNNKTDEFGSNKNVDDVTSSTFASDENQLLFPLLDVIDLTDSVVAESFINFVEVLRHQGWQIIPGNGGHWWSFRFRRNTSYANKKATFGF